MKNLLPLAAVYALTALPVLAAEVPALDESYAAVDAKLTETLDGIRRDLVALADAGTFPQLEGIEDSEIRHGSSDYTYHLLAHQKDATPTELLAYRYGKGGCRIDLEFRSYDAKTDPRHGRTIAPARVTPHFQAGAGGVPFAIRCEVEAEPTEAGKAFTKRVNELIGARVADLKKELGAVAVEWDDLVGLNKPRDASQLEKEAYIILEGTVIGHSEQRYQETGMPERVSIKVTKLLGGRLGFDQWAKVDDVIPLDTWGLKPSLELPVGAGIKAFLKFGQAVDAPEGEGRRFHPVAPNGLQILKPAP